jgi:site-specific DNA-cytosine methylase
MYNQTNKTNMKVLVACEESQAVTKEFRKLGHEAFSCDLQECSGGHPEWHLQQDVTELLEQNWDLIIAFPPCTDLAVSGARHFERKIADGSQQKSIEFFMTIANSNCQRIAIENPIGIMSGKWRKPDQIIQPWQFGDKAQKSTCLWLKGLPKLAPTEIVEKGEFFEFTSKKGEKKRMPMWYYKALQDAKTPEQRRTLRSKTFPGIAKAMAEQWGNL